jgi:hypothetical protein
MFKIEYEKWKRGQPNILDFLLSYKLKMSEMSDIVELPAASVANPTYHYGSFSNYAKYIGEYFIETANPEHGKLYVITNVIYEPDSLYRSTDGYAGRCWTVTVYDSVIKTFANYYIRNWIDIVHYYETIGFAFVEPSSKSKN